MTATFRLRLIQDYMKTWTKMYHHLTPKGQNSKLCAFFYLITHYKNRVGLYQIPLSRTSPRLWMTAVGADMFHGSHTSLPIASHGSEAGAAGCDEPTGVSPPPKSGSRHTLLPATARSAQTPVLSSLYSCMRSAERRAL